MTDFHRSLSILVSTACLITLLSTCVTTPEPLAIGRKPVAYDPMPQPEREFRGLWVATISNLDWPSARGLSAEQQQAEGRAILDRAVELKLNAIFLQVRPSGDAFYRSATAPWSIYLSGTMGRDPGYDPLAWWIAEAHRRGLQLHAWFNPFRVGNPSIKAADYSPDSLPVTHPEMVRTVGSKGYLWLDPGDPGAVNQVMSVVRDLVGSYDLDGLVMDDYFYPYADFYEPGEDFDDDAGYQQACQNGFAGSQADWRRANLDSFVQRVYGTVKSIKAKVLVGISPFGIWRPDFPRGIAGKDSYAEIYTDTRYWLNEGWLDYLSPQLYWPIKQSAQSLPALLEWWKGENLKGRHIWPALNLAGPASAALPSDEIRSHEFASQLLTVHGMLPADAGFVLFRAGSLLERAGSRDNPLYLGQATINELRSRALARSALVPASPWLDAVEPAAPAAHWFLKDNELTISWEANPDAFRWVVYIHRTGTDTPGGRIPWDQQVLPASHLSTSRDFRLDAAPDKPIDRLIVTAVSRTGVESVRNVLMVNGAAPIPDPAQP